MKCSVDLGDWIANRLERLSQVGYFFVKVLWGRNSNSSRNKGFKDNIYFEQGCDEIRQEGIYLYELFLEKLGRRGSHKVDEQQEHLRRVENYIVESP